MPFQLKDYAKNDSFLEGAKMFLMTQGIKNEAEQNKYLNQLQEQQFQLDIEKNAREMSAEERLEKKATADLKEADARTKNLEADILAKQQKAMEDQATMQAKQIASIRRTLIADSSQDMTPNALAQMLTGEIIKSDNVTEMGDLVTGLNKSLKPEVKTYAPNWKTYYDPTGAVHTLNTAIDSPQANWTPTNPVKPEIELKKEMTMNSARTALTSNQYNKNSFQNTAPIFNKMNANNEVAYWDEENKEGLFNRQKAKIIQLPEEAINLGWTPDKIQEVAKNKGKTIRQVLIDIGVL